jgi:WD40 repeat protein/uncharacterized caspase-like protein
MNVPITSGILLAGILSFQMSSLGSAQTSSMDRGTVSEILALLNELGYAPGVSTDKIDTETDYALTLYVKAEQPQDLSGLNGTYQKDALRYRDSLRAAVKRYTEIEHQPQIFIEAPHGRSGAKLTVDPAGSHVLTSDGSSLKSWDTALGRQKWASSLPSVISSNPVVYTTIALSDDGRYAFAASNAIRVFDNNTGKIIKTFWSRTRNGQTSKITKIAARPNSSELVTDDEDGRIVIYDWSASRFVAELGKHEKSYFQEGNVRRSQIMNVDDIQISPDGRFAASIATDFGVRIWDLQLRRLHRFFTTPAGVTFEKLAFFNDGRMLAASVKSISMNRAYRNDLFFFDVDRGQVATFPFTTVYNLETAADGKGLIVKGTTPDPKSYGMHIFDGKGNYVRKLPSVSADRIAGDRTFTIEDGLLQVGSLTEEKKYKGRQPTPGFSGFIREADKSALRLFGSGNGIFTFDISSGSVRLDGKLVRPKDENPYYVAAFATPAGQIVAQTQADAESANVWVPSRLHSPEGSTICSHKINGTPVSDLATINGFDYSSALDLTASLFNETIYIHKASDCSELRQIPLSFATGARAKLNWYNGSLPAGLRFSADGRTLLAWRAEAAVQAFDPVTGQRKMVYLTGFDNGPIPSELSKALPNVKKRGLFPLVYNVVAVPNSKGFAAVIGGNAYTGNAYTDGLIEIFEEGNPRFTASYELRTQPDRWSVIDPGGRTWLASLSALGVNTTSVMTGAHISGFGRQPSDIQAMAFSPDGRLAFILAGDGVLRAYSAATGELLLTTVVLADGGWLSITSEGFFASEGGGERAVRVRQGTTLVDIDQIYQSLYRPDLVREKLTGDPRGLVREAATTLDLNKVIGSGNAPDVRATLPGLRLGTADLQVTVDAEVTDRGGRVGRVEWRVNGVTTGIDNPAPPVAGQVVRLTRVLSLDVGDNIIEVTAYNGSNLIASAPSRISVAAQAPISAPVPGAAIQGQPPVQGPRLFVLAAGSDKYADRRFQLQFSVADAKAIAQAFVDSGKGLYKSVEIKVMSDAEVVVEKLDAAFQDLAKVIQPPDVFVLYLAGHGKTVDGRYYFVPQNFKLAGDATGPAVDAAVKVQGISQEQWQLWFALVSARRSMILFDTCESGTLTGGAGQTQALERGAANDRLAQATGRSIITAANGQQEAFEGYRGHGLFTYNILDALDRGDSDSSGTIEVTELAAYVYAQVTATSERIFKQRQEPQMKITLNYPLTRQAHVLADDAPAVAMETKPTYQVKQTAQLQIKPSNGATVVRSLSAKTAVTVVKSENGWSLIARGGKPLGYVATRDLAPIR